MKRIILLTVSVLLFVIPSSAQRNSQKSVSTPRTLRVEIIPYPDPTEMSIRISRFIKVLRKYPKAKVYVIVYPESEYQVEGARGLLRGAKERLKEKGIASKRIVLLEGMFREITTAELYIVPKGGIPPVPTPIIEKMDDFDDYRPASSVIFQFRLQRNGRHIKALVYN
jgi:hypothetical protein